MERKRTLELVAVESDVAILFQYSYVTSQHDIELILGKANYEGDFHNLNGSRCGTIRSLHYEPLGIEHAILHRVTLTFGEFNELGRPRKIQETKTYDPVSE
ncbi:hypothetical protein J4410_03990 [Candidatus Woesearchaeota archaeon]|nr:hypothetical protein [Candidatus Woesearchaeota archaeon]